MNNAKTVSCKRCNGSGFFMTEERTCFGCAGRGVVYADKFHNVLGASGKFFGVTGPARTYGALKGTAVKEIIRAASQAAAEQHLEAGSVVVEITEEQARQFFARYGVRTDVKV